MFEEKDSEHLSQKPVLKENPDGEIGFREGFQTKPLKIGGSDSQELTLSYLCDSKFCSFPEKDVCRKVSQNHKGKEIISENSDQEERWVERDFLKLNEITENSFKREIEREDDDRESIKKKKPKWEVLNLSLALPDASRTQTSYSNDFTVFSYSCSHPLSHNPSCSLTRNSTENYDPSVGREADGIWHCGEGTNGSVHSRFKPISDGGVGFSSHGNAGFALMQANRMMSKDSCTNNSFYQSSSDNVSFFPSELPAKPRTDIQSDDSRGRGLEKTRGLGSMNGRKDQKLSTPERILREIVSESIPIMAQIIQELPDETIESTKQYLKNLIETPAKREELVGLKNRLERRSDLSNDTLSKANKNQLEILVSIKTGLGSFLGGNILLSTVELVEIFLLVRCRNVNCKSLLPVDDCDCRICSMNKGFCSSCMCPVCLNFDCANNTCSWVGCDVCSHWCHAECGLQKLLIRPGPSLKGPAGTTEMQFHCLGCGHASEMFGFVKDVFVFCAKAWGFKTLIKELDCVGKIFKGSDDLKGKELHCKAEEVLAKLDAKLVLPSDACDIIMQFFNYIEDRSELPVSSLSSKEVPTPPSLRNDMALLPPSNGVPPKHSIYSIPKAEVEFQLPEKKDGFDSLGSMVRIKEVEAMMFQSRSDEARREAETYRRVVRAKKEKLEEEYAERLAKLCLQETEERRRRKLEELRMLENSHCDYYNMKLRMQAEIAGLLERMEKIRQLWV